LLLKPSTHPLFSRDHEYKLHDTVSLLPDITLLISKLYAQVEHRHHSREFINFVNLLDAGYPADPLDP